MIVIKDDLCDYCGTCVSVCPHDAIELMEARILIDDEKCTDCLSCVRVCPMRVLEGGDNER